MKLTSVFAVSVGILCRTLQASVINVSGLELATVQAAIDAARDGDTILLPAGTVTWNTLHPTVSYAALVIFNKAVHLQGAGVDATTIRGSFGNKSDVLMSVACGSKAVEISNMTLEDAKVTATFFQNGIISLYATSYTPWRIHDMRITNYYGRSIGVHGYECGLIDHVTFQAPSVNNAIQSVAVIAYSTGRESWLRPPSYGQSNQVYIENCIFNHGTRQDSGIEGYRGARICARYNTFTNAGIGMHGLDTDDLVDGGSAYSMEIYNNHFHSTGSVVPGYGLPWFTSRGGSCVIYSNSFSADWVFNKFSLALDLYRSRGDNAGTGADGPIDGSRLLDGNSPAGGGDSGSHNGDATSAILTDTSKSWDVNQFVVAPGGIAANRNYYIWNRTDGSGGFVVSNTASTVTATLAGGVRNYWHPGDIYVITEGYPARDGHGRTGPEIVHAKFTDQPFAGCYEWNNTYNKGLPSEHAIVFWTSSEYQFMADKVTPLFPSQNDLIKSGRDYFDDTVKPGYTAFAYPHPGRVQKPAPPGNLTR